MRSLLAVVLVAAACVSAHAADDGPPRTCLDLLPKVVELCGCDEVRTSRPRANIAHRLVGKRCEIRVPGLFGLDVRREDERR